LRFKIYLLLYIKGVSMYILVDITMFISLLIFILLILNENLEGESNT